MQPPSWSPSVDAPRMVAFISGTDLRHDVSAEVFMLEPRGDSAPSG